MSFTHKQFSRRIGRRRECRHTRPMLELLERRDCPAVQAFFAAGVLSVVGDEGNNVIQLFQPRDRVVEVMGDGQTWVFEEVDEVLVDAGDGDDQATSSKPKEIVVVGSKIKMEMGAGNDTVRIDDGGPLEKEPNLLSTMNYSLNLGTGADVLRVAAENSGILNLSVQSADGSDRHELGHTLGFRHEHTRPESIVRMDLAGSGTLVDVDFDNIEQVDLSIVSQPVPGEPAAEGAVFVRWHVFGHDSSFIGRNDGHVQMLAASSGGSSSGVSPTALLFSATAGGISTRPLATVTLSGSGSDPDSAAITTGDTDDTVSILSDKVDLQLAADLGAGDDSFAGNYRLANGSKSIVDVAGGAGRDTVAHAPEYTEDIAPLDFAGAFQATAVAEVVDLELRNAPVAGDFSAHAAVADESDTSRASLHLAPGEDVLHDDLLIVDVVSFEQVDLHLASAPNPDRPEKIDLATVTYDDPASTSVRLTDRDDGLTLDVDNVNQALLGWATFPSTVPSPDPVHLDRVNLVAVTNDAAPATSVHLDDGDDGLHVDAAGFSETRLAWEGVDLARDSASTLNPSVTNVFSTASFRFGHVQLDVDPVFPQATLLTEFGGPGNVEVAGQFPAVADSEERPTFVSGLRVEEADALAVSSHSVQTTPARGDLMLTALDADAVIPAATEYEFENEAENIPAVRFAVNAPDQHDGVVLLHSSLPGGSSASGSPVSSITVTFSASLSAGSALLLDLASGDQADVLDASASGFDKVALNLHTGGGDDLIGWDFSHSRNDPAAPSVESHGRGVDALLTIDLGAGDDALSFVNADANSIQLFLTGGEGDDSAMIDGTSNTFIIGESPPSLMNIDLGSGANQLSVETTGFAEMTQDIRSGDGIDQIEIRDRRGPFFQFESKRLNQRIHTGGGNDIVLNDSEGSDEVQSLIDLGSGDDVVLTRYSWAFLIQMPRTRLNLELSLGAGSDVAEFEAGGYRALVCVFYNGPPGDGPDLIMGSIYLSPLDRLRRIRRVLDGRQDLFELFVSADYDVQVTIDGNALVVSVKGTN